MKVYYPLILLFLFILPGRPAHSQVNISEEKSAFPLFKAYYAYQFPGHDLAKRFGNSSLIGGGFHYKFRSNILLGVEGGFIFGENIRDRSSYLQMISTGDGEIISEGGTYASVFLHQRGFNLSLRAGGIINLLGPNPNSGLLLMGGVGMLQHKIRIEVENNDAPQLSSAYKKGYDRLTNGPAINQYLGYVHFGNDRTINFHIGLEFTQAWTKARRPWDFDLMQPETGSRFESLWSIRAGWILPLYKRTTRDYYYF